MSLRLLLSEVAVELLTGWLEERRRKRLARAHAETPVTPQACPKCLEIAYSPGQARCFKCGAGLVPASSLVTWKAEPS
jgi:hypothetical protein